MSMSKAVSALGDLSASSWCAICNPAAIVHLIPTDVPGFRNHLYLHHGKTDSEYADMVRCLQALRKVEGQILPVNPCPPAAAPKSSGGDNKVVEVKLNVNNYVEERRRSPPPPMVQTPESAAKFQSRCKFACKECAHLANSWASFREHVKKEHPMSVKKGQNLNPEEYVVVPHRYRCVLCNAELLEDRTLLERHARNAHGLTMTEYMKVAISRAKRKAETPKKISLPTSSSVNVSDTPPPAKKTLLSPAKKADPRLLQHAKLQSLIQQPGNRFECAICFRILPGTTLQAMNRHCAVEHQINLLQYFKMTANDHADWKDACLFKCQVCWKLETTSRPDFLEHLLLIHSMVGSQYEATYGRLELTTSSLVCPKCGKDIIHSSEHLTKHKQESGCDIEGLLSSYRRKWGVE